MPDKDLVDLCPPIEPYQVTKSPLFFLFLSIPSPESLRNEKVGFLFGIANSRQVSIEKGKALPVKDLEIPEEGLVVYLKSFVWVKVFCQQFKNEPQYYIVYHRDLDVLNQTTQDEFKSLHDSYWQIEEFH